MSILKNILPLNGSDKQSVSSTFNTESRHAALVLFNESKLRLLDINSWSRLCHGTQNEFCLTDRYGVHLETALPSVGDLIRIRQPLPPNASEAKFSWARIENFEGHKDLLKDEELFGFCIRPIDGPLQVKSKNDHLYTGDVLNYFLIYRKGCVLMAIEQEKSTSGQAGISWWNKLRIKTIEVLAMMRLYRSQWKRLLSGILKPSFS